MIKKWTQFNEELNQLTYKNAANKLKKMGHKQRGSSLHSHSEDMLVRESEKYGIGEIEFQNDVKAKFAGFDFDMSLDVYIDNEYKYFALPLYFQFPDEWDGDTIFYPVSFEYDIDDDRFILFAYSEEALEDLYKSTVLKFKNRKDVMRIISVLKKLDLHEEIGQKCSEEEFEKYKSDYNKMISKIKINNLYEN